MMMTSKASWKRSVCTMQAVVCKLSQFQFGMTSSHRYHVYIATPEDLSITVYLGQ